MLIKYKDNYIPKIQLNTKPLLVENELCKIKCLFITGGAGFIGSNFINIICKKYPNIKVINFDTLYYCANKEQYRSKQFKSLKIIIHRREIYNLLIY